MKPPKIRYQTPLRLQARALRAAPTNAEQRLWHRLNRRQLLDVRFYRQRPLGSYIVDFYSPNLRLVIEVDGSQHLAPEGQQYDHHRDAWLRQQGLTVIRFDNLQVLQHTDAVVEAILQKMREIQQGL